MKKGILFILITILGLNIYAQRQIINVGTFPNDGTGDPLRTVALKCNHNFKELYDSITWLRLLIPSSVTIGNQINDTANVLRQLLTEGGNFPGFGTTHYVAAYGDHNHDGRYLPIAGTAANSNLFMGRDSGYIKLHWGGGSYTGSSGIILTGSNFTWDKSIISAISPLSYSNSTGVFSIQQASGSQAGSLSQTDWRRFDTTFNYFYGFGNGNIKIGINNLQKTSTGNSNIAIGDGSMYNVSSGVSNIGIGSYALNSNTGSFNTAIGYYAGTTSTGSNNIFIGPNSGYNIGSKSYQFYVDSRPSKDSLSAFLFGNISTGKLMHLNDSVVTAQKLRNGDYGHFGGGGISTVNTTAPILGNGSSGSPVKADTGYHKGALVPFCLHQKDSIANTLKQNKADTVNTTQDGVMTKYDYSQMLYNTPARNLTFSGSIDLTNHKSSNYKDYSITGTLSVTIASNPVDGSVAGVILIANGNGSNIPTFTGLYLVSGAWVNTNGTKNIIAFWQLGGHTCFSIGQPTIQ